MDDLCHLIFISGSRRGKKFIDKKRKIKKEKNKEADGM